MSTIDTAMNSIRRYYDVLAELQCVPKEEWKYPEYLKNYLVRSQYHTTYSMYATHDLFQLQWSKWQSELDGNESSMNTVEPDVSDIFSKIAELKTESDKAYAELNIYMNSHKDEVNKYNQQRINSVKEK